LTAIASQVRTELATELARIDAAISSRHAAGAAVAKSPATLDWSADVSNKPTIPALADIRNTSLYTGAFTAEVLANAPAGGEGGGLTDEQEAQLTAIKTQTDRFAFDYTTGRAAKLDNLDATVSSRLASADYSAAAIAAAVWTYGTRTLSSFGTLIASIWSYAGRTLTGATLGLGPDVQRSRVDGYQTMPQGSTDPLYKRVLARDGSDLLPADVTSITYSIFALSGNPPERTAVEGHENVTLDKTAVLFDEVRSDQWASNYNFKHIPDISENTAFAAAGVEYLVEYTITPTSGQKIIERIRVKAT